MANLDREKTMDISSQVVAAAVGDEKVLRLFYQDFAQPGVRQVGKALSTVLGLGNTALLPVKLVNAKALALYRSHMEQYRKNLEQISEDKIIEVVPEIGVPILENLEKTTNEVISKMYINLLTKASHVDFVNQAHPRFVSVIQSLTQDEAFIISQLGADVLFINIFGHITFTDLGKTQYGVCTYYSKVTEYHKGSKLNIPERASFYFDNLRGLGLLTEHNGSNRSNRHGDPYAKLKKTFEAESVPGIHPQAKIEIVEGRYESTPFCNLFREACEYLPESNNSEA